MLSDQSNLNGRNVVATSTRATARGEGGGREMGVFVDGGLNQVKDGEEEVDGEEWGGCRS